MVQNSKLDQMDVRPDERTNIGYIFCSKIPSKTLKVPGNTNGMNRIYSYYHSLVLDSWCFFKYIVFFINKKKHNLYSFTKIILNEIINLRTVLSRLLE